MKRTLFIASLLACCMSYHASAANYDVTTTYNLTDIQPSTTPDTYGISYENGKFSIEQDGWSVGSTVGLTINLENLCSYLESSDYQTKGNLLMWDVTIKSSKYSYGVSFLNTADNTTTLAGTFNNNTYDSNPVTLYEYLQQYEVDGKVELVVTTSNKDGVKIYAANRTGSYSTVFYRSDFKFSDLNNIASFTVNTNYVEEVALIEARDYSKPFISQRSDGTTLNRITFLGDSITHGVDDKSYRWQLFKILSDNGIENEMAGPRSGHYSEWSGSADKGSSYGGIDFDNKHMAYASGRTYNIITGASSGTVNGVSFSKGPNYDGHTTASVGENYDSNNWFCMMGTNDLLSDTATNGTATEADFASKMQFLLGGTVQYNSETKHYEWSRGDSWGSMGTIVSDVYGEGDTFYMLSITPWANHCTQQYVPNHRDAKDYYAGQEFNRLLQEWVSSYKEATQQNVEYVDVTRGMVDYTSDTSFTDASGKTYYFKSHDDFFNDNPTNSWDRLHPNAQGSLLMAGNLARHLKIGGRTAGLERMGTEGWESKQIGTVTDGTTILAAEDAFTRINGYTVDFTAKFGNGDTDGTWLDSSSALSITLGDGFNGGTLNLSEGYIMWGTDVLFCWDNSNLDKEGSLRIAWHNGNTADNILSGYYVWLGDMLIGQGLEASQNITLNGIRISANGADGEINGLSWTNTAYAPTTDYTTSAEYALLTTQNTPLIPLMPEADRINTPTSSGVTYGTPSTNYTKAYISCGSSTGTHTFALGNTTISGGSLAIVKTASGNATGTINTLIAGDIHASLIGVEAGATAKNLVIETNDSAVIQDNTDKQGAIVASYGGNSVQNFSVYVNGGAVGGDIVGGESKTEGTGVVGQTNIYINNGTISGNILGGGKSANGSVGNATIRVNGGTITGSIIAGGTAGSIGNTDVTITGGIIKGGIEMGTATRTNNGTANVTIIGNKASIGGNITADNVTLRDVTATPYSDGFDKYAGTISATRLTLDNVQVDLQTALSKNITSIELINNTRAGAVLGDTFILQKLLLSDGTSFSAHKQVGTSSTNMTSSMESTLQVSVLEVGMGATLNANLSFSEGSVLRMSDTLTMGSDVALVDGMVLELSESMLQDLYGYNPVVLFSGVDNLTLNGEVITEGSYVNVDGVFTNLNPEFHYNISYVGSYVTLIIPEPATATLSLLALAALAARRRRK